jgi:gamma-D-glutamyl-L-lysine dipeptidyl-peptidase
MSNLLVVADPVTDIRRKPADSPRCYTHDEDQETQALYNEVLLCCDTYEDWYRIEATEQRECDRNGIWRGYPGWVRKTSVIPVEESSTYNVVVITGTARVLAAPSEEARELFALSIGTKLGFTGVSHGQYCRVELVDKGHGWVERTALRRRSRRVKHSRLRQNIVATGRLFLGAPYLWGGRSMLVPEPDSTPSHVLTGVDCSGLSNLAYRANNIDIPRNAHAQWVASQKITAEELSLGDLVFMWEEGRSHAITHVMLFTGGETFIEAPETGGAVRTGTFSAKFGNTLAGLAVAGLMTGDKRICLGRIIDRP